jgi:hypothetical protein
MMVMMVTRCDLSMQMTSGRIVPMRSIVDSRSSSVTRVGVRVDQSALTKDIRDGDGNGVGRVDAVRCRIHDVRCRHR